MHAVIQLPYQGPHREATAKVKAQAYRSIEIPFADLRQHELNQVEDATRSADPYDVLVRKVTHLAQLLDITEQEAERVLFDRLGQ